MASAMPGAEYVCNGGQVTYFLTAPMQAFCQLTGYKFIWRLILSRSVRTRMRRSASVNTSWSAHRWLTFALVAQASVSADDVVAASSPETPSRSSPLKFVMISSPMFLCT